MFHLVFFHNTAGRTRNAPPGYFSKKMTLHPHITRAELDAYTHLAWEHRVRRVKVDAKTLQTIHNLLKTDTHYGVKYTTAP